MNDHGRPGRRKDRRRQMLIGGAVTTFVLVAFGVKAYQSDQEQIARENGEVTYYGVTTESLMLSEGARTLSPG